MSSSCENKCSEKFSNTDRRNKCKEACQATPNHLEVRKNHCKKICSSLFNNSNRKEKCKSACNEIKYKHTVVGKSEQKIKELEKVIKTLNDQLSQV